MKNWEVRLTPTAVSPVKTFFYNNSTYRWLKANLWDKDKEVYWFKVKVMIFQQKNNKITETFYNQIIKPCSDATVIFIHL